MQNIDEVYQGIYNTAEHYIDLGLPVIPLCPADEVSHNKMSPGHRKICKCQGKVPLIKNWVTRTTATTGDLDSWKKDFKQFNIGLPMGSASGYVGIDVDGEEGEDLLEDMSDGNLPETWEFSTGAGRRLLYQIPQGIPTKKFTNTGDAVHQECAILCTGQQTVLPPSYHYTGNQYNWIEDKSPDDIDCAMAPKWLMDLITLDRDNKSIPTQPKDAPLSDITQEFIALTDEEGDLLFIVDTPAEITETEAKPVKKQKSGESGISEILNKVIVEGGRDNAMTKVIGHYLAQESFRKMDPEILTETILAYNRKYMQPPLADNDVKIKLEHFLEIEKQKSAEFKNVKKDKIVWTTDKAAQICLNKIRSQGLLVKKKEALNKYYVCTTNQGPWHEAILPEENISNITWLYMNAPWFEDTSYCTNAKHKELLEGIDKRLSIEGNSAIDPFDIHTFALMFPNILIIGGQPLNWRTGELLPWDPMYSTEMNFDIEYDPYATCPNWNQYLEQWLPEEDERFFLQEFMGNALLPKSAPEEKFIILQGNGSNGKSMFLFAMDQIFGNLKSSLSLRDFTDKFGPANLQNKLVNICSELEDEGSYLANTAAIKKIVSGDPVSAEFKGKDKFPFKPVVSCIFSCNTLPKVKDTSDGYMRRQTIINFDQKFRPDSVVGEQMKRNILAEKPGIFNWLLKGLQRYTQRGYFIEPAKAILAKQKFKEHNDPLEKFTKECLCKFDAGEMAIIKGTKTKQIGTATTIVRRLYECWCSYNNNTSTSNFAKSQTAFNTAMEGKDFRIVKPGLCLYKKKNTAIFVNTDLAIDVTNEALCDTIEEMCEDYSGSSQDLKPDYVLMEYVRKAKKELAEQEQQDNT